MSNNNYVRQAQVQGVWGPVPDRRELLAQGNVTPAPINTATILAELSKNIQKY